MNNEKHQELTLKELKQAIKICKYESRCPSVNAVEHSGVPVIAQHEYMDGSRLTAYENGYVTYINGRRKTVVALKQCGDYTYFTRTEEKNIPESSFMEMPWYIRVQMEADDRIVHNTTVYEKDKNIRFHQSDLDENSASDEICMEQMLETEQQVEQLLALLTERQALIMRLCYLEELERKTVAEILGISISAVTDAISKSIKRLQKKCWKVMMPACKRRLQTWVGWRKQFLTSFFGGTAMAGRKPKEREKYIIRIQEKPIEVSKEVYQYWYASRHKIGKQGSKDRKNGLIHLEDLSPGDYEKVVNTMGCQYSSVEEIIVQKILIEQLLQAIEQLQEENQMLIQALYYERVSERTFAKRIGVSHVAVQKRKNKLLQELKKMLLGDEIKP